MLKALPSVRRNYQKWYSESHAVIKQLLPDRLKDFIAHYEKPKNRKQIGWDNYVMQDYLQGIQNEYTGLNKSAALSELEQQVFILQACEERFKSKLFDIKQLVQADLFDSELDAARELSKHKFQRAAGAVAGVVLEKHLSQVCDNHNIAATKKNPSISDLNDLLKKHEVVDTIVWRGIQRLGDLRNLCDHHKEKEPTADDAAELIGGVDKLTKTLF
jgi:hypothetical protein